MSIPGERKLAAEETIHEMMLRIRQQYLTRMFHKNGSLIKF